MNKEPRGTGGGETKYELGTIVQITDESHGWFPCLVVVTECKNWGVQGYVSMPTADGVGNAFIRLKHEAIEVVGHAAVYIKREQEDSHE